MTVPGGSRRAAFAIDVMPIASVRSRCRSVSCSSTVSSQPTAIAKTTKRNGPAIRASASTPVRTSTRNAGIVGIM